MTDRSVYKPVLYFDLSASYEFGDEGEFQWFVSVENLFDKKPPFNAPTGNPGLGHPSGTQYDVIGRYFTSGVRYNF